MFVRRPEDCFSVLRCLSISALNAFRLQIALLWPLKYVIILKC